MSKYQLKPWLEQTESTPQSGTSLWNRKIDQKCTPLTAGMPTLEQLSISAKTTISVLRTLICTNMPLKVGVRRKGSVMFLWNSRKHSGLFLFPSINTGWNSTMEAIPALSNKRSGFYSFLNTGRRLSVSKIWSNRLQLIPSFAPI